MAEIYVAVDVETTGLDPACDEIIEIGLCRIENGAVTEKFSSLVRATGSVPLRVKQLTGIDDDMLQGAPGWEELAGEVASFIGDAPMVGHHIAFDAGFLSRYLNDPFTTRPLLDTCELARFLLPAARGYSLARVAESLEIDFPEQHRALPDAEATARVFVALISRLKRLSPAVLSTAAFLLERGGAAWAPFFREMLRNAVNEPVRITSPYAFLESEPEEGESGLIVAETVDPADFFRPGGRLTGVLPAYEYRAQQEEMAAAVTETLRDGTCLLVEAGTGIGKSLAYLIPLVLRGLADNKRVLVSTHTVNLQEQLLRNDVPSVKTALGVDFPVALVKGRQHYLCLRRWERLLEEGDFGAAAALFYARVLLWLTTTHTGDFSQLSLNEAEREAQARVAATAEGCFGKKCAWAGRCFVNNARRRAEKAAVIITNHALLLTDAFAGGSVLPDYGPLVVDEAHHLEDVATECLTLSVSKRDVIHWLSRLRPLLSRAGNALRLSPAWEGREKRISTAGDAVKNAAEGFFTLLENSLHAKTGANGGAPSLSLRDKGAHLVMDTAAKDYYLALTGGMGTLLGSCRDLLREMEGWQETWLQEMELWVREGEELSGTITGIVNGSGPDRVEWAEGRFFAGSLQAVLKSAPVSVAEPLSGTLFPGSRGMVLTSATMAVEGRFDHFADRIGLNRLPPDSYSSKVIGSPFVYKEKAALCIVRDLPLWREVSDKDYLSSVADVLARLARTTGERMLVLFTANKIMREVVMRLKPILEAEEIVVLAQGIDGGRTRLVEEFRHTPRVVLCGTASFWEGIDIGGGILRVVVIVKLPFPPFETPVLAARRARLIDSGQDDFRRLSLPYAILRFKQGFGRLIRSHQDDGVVVVLDRRLVNKSYGLSFIRSLPELPVAVLPMVRVCEWLRDRLEECRKTL